MLNSAHSSVKLFSFRLAATTNSTRCSCTLFVLQAILALSPGFLTVTPARLLRAKCKGCRGTFCKGCHGTGHLKAHVKTQNEWASAPVLSGYTNSLKVALLPLKAVRFQIHSLYEMISDCLCLQLGAESLELPFNDLPI